MKNYLIFSLVVVALVFLSIMISQLSFPSTVEMIDEGGTAKVIFSNATGEVEMMVPAVDSKGNGVVTTLKVQATPGEGRTLANINQLLFWVDTQHSIQIAKQVAENVTDLNLSQIDLIYSIETEAVLIEGPSAGAALTVATIASLENKNINHNVMITGTVMPNGEIGPVGGILEKAEVSKDVGAEIFLVPKGQGRQTIYTPEKECELIGSFTYCTTEYKRQTVNIGSETDIEIIEVDDINEALKYFLT